MGANDEIASALTTGQLAIESSLASPIGATRKVLTALQEKLTAQILDGPELSDGKKKDLQSLLRNANAAIDAAMSSNKEISNSELADVAEAAAEHVTDSLTEKFVGWQPSGLNAEEINAVSGGIRVNGVSTDSWWATHSDATKRKFDEKISLGILSGETNAQLVRAVRGTKAEGYNDGIMKATRRDTEMIVRTTTQSALNQARLATYEKNADIITAVRHSSTLDGRTSPICVARSGLVYDIVDGSYIPRDHGVPFLSGAPYHPNCRSTMAPITKSWADLSTSKDPKVIAKLKKFQPGPSTKASMDGQVPSDLTFKQWVDSKPKGFLDGLIGPGKAELVASGKAKLSDILDSHGQVRSVEQLKAFSVKKTATTKASRAKAKEAAAAAAIESSKIADGTKASNFATSKKQLLDRAELYIRGHDDLYITEQTKRDELKDFKAVQDVAKKQKAKPNARFTIDSLAIREAMVSEGLVFDERKGALASDIREALKKPKLQAMLKARETAVFIAEKKRVEFIADKVFGAPESLTKNLLPVKRKGGAKRDDERRDVMRGILSRFAGQERMDALANNYKHDVKKGTRASHTGFRKDPTTGNAYVYANGFKSVGTIATDKDESLGTILHEYLHAVEHLDTEVLAKSITYRESRRAPGELDKRAEDVLGYDGNAPVLEDDWKLDKYAGKRYVDATGETKNDRASEVLTMWATHAMDDLAVFIEEEPDYFWWGYKTLTELDQ
jgi:SPP1 gp7 family putative phage head morphogenesis protein